MPRFPPLRTETGGQLQLEIRRARYVGSTRSAEERGRARKDDAWLIRWGKEAAVGFSKPCALERIDTVAGPTVAKRRGPTSGCGAALWPRLLSASHRRMLSAAASVLHGEGQNTARRN